MDESLGGDVIKMVILVEFCDVVFSVFLGLLGFVRVFVGIVFVWICWCWLVCCCECWWWWFWYWWLVYWFWELVWCVWFVGFLLLLGVVLGFGIWGCWVVVLGLGFWFWLIGLICVGWVNCDGVLDVIILISVFGIGWGDWGGGWV